MWLNFLGLLPSTVLTLLLITIAFLRFYDQTDFEFLGLIAQPRNWSNGFTVAALLATLANFGVEWNRRNRETNRLAQATERETRRDDLANQERNKADRERNRANRERARAASRARIQNRGFILQTRYQLAPNPDNEKALADFLSFLQEYGE